RVSRVCAVPGAYAWARPKPRPLRTRSAGRRRGTMMHLPPAPSRLSVAERAKVPQGSDRRAGDGSAEALF
ncbi:MAG: hypothetical protein V3S27_03740, partial [Kiloniellales bacterium]